VGSKISADNVKKAMNGGRVDGLALYVDEDRQQRAATILRDVAYMIEAHFERTPRAGDDDTEAKHLAMFNRRAAAGQCFHQPCLGTREFPAEFALVDGDLPATELPAHQRNRELG
jgi:CRISPR-associated protein Cas5d